MAGRTAVNIPFEDDYDAIAGFHFAYLDAHGPLSKAWLILTYQFVQYKLMFMHAVVALEYQLTRHIDYKLLQYLGDLTLPLTVVILWFFLARSGRPLSQRVWLFVVPAFIYLSPFYADTINWAMSGLHIAVIPFALASIFFYTANSRASHYLGLAFLALAIATSASGFILALVLILILVAERRYAASLAIAAIAAAMAALYAVHYFRPPPWPGTLPLHITVGRFILFDLAFLGGAAGRPYPAILLGLLLLLGFVGLWRGGWRRACPGTFTVALFCVATSLLVAQGRFQPGYAFATQDRYKMYCLLLLCLEYMAVLRLYAPATIPAGSRWWNAVLVLSVVAAVLCITADVLAYRMLRLRQRTLITHLILWERHPELLVLVPDERPDRQESWIPLRTRFQDNLQREVAMGIYQPPYSADDPLPIRTHSPSTVGIEDEAYPASQHSQ